ncbi:counting factor 60-like [Acropora palmata]|uniref:counting factor 60-like n=1 Tax=Acropora palmata TaxID=6131 RepID=UPI003DA05E48
MYGQYFVIVLGSILCSIALIVGADLPDYCGEQTYAYTPLTKRGGTQYALKQVHVVIRHGDRTRAFSAPCWDNDNATWDCLLSSASIPVIKHDIHDITVNRIYRDVYMPGRNVMKGDCGLGHLTFKGYKQELTNGENLRRAYVDTGFLTNYSVSEVFLRSDDMSRTRQSAQALALGLFPPPAPSSDKAQIFDIHVMDINYDDMEPNPTLCPKLGQYQRECYNTDSWKKHYQQFTAPLLAEVQTALGLKYNLTSEALLHIADCLLTHICHGFPIPPNMTQDLVNRVTAEVEFWWYTMMNYPSPQKYAKVGIGFLIAEMWKEMQAAVAGEKTKKFYLYSGHDNTVMPLLVALNASDYKWCPYASMVQLELLEVLNPTNTDYAVRLLFNGEERHIKSYCDASPCSLAQFMQFIRDNTPEDPVKDCHVTNHDVMFRPRPPIFSRAHALF